jgi:hypothetical protein
MDTTNVAAPATTAHAIDGNQLAAMPCLDIVATCPHGELIPLLEKLVHYFVSANLLPIGQDSETILTYDEGTQMFEEVLTLEKLNSLQLEFQKASAKAVRRLPSTLIFTKKTSVDSITPFFKSLRLTIGLSFFPDDPLAISACIRSSAVSAWADLDLTKNGLIEVLGTSFYYSTIGYGFACDPAQVTKAGAQMEHACMRYLGVDLDDPFGNFTAIALYGLRSINWEVTVAEKVLQDLSSTERKKLEIGAAHVGSTLAWKTGAAPSLCDRNLISDHPQLAAYAALDKQLKLLKFPYQLSWAPTWDDSSAERWRNRWSEIK